MARKKKDKLKKCWRRRSKPGDALGQILVDPVAVPTVVRVIALGSDYLEKEIADVHEL